MHAYGVAKKLGLRSVVIPAQAGVASAVGLLLAPLACDVTEVCVAVLGQNLSEAKVGALSSVLEELGRTASERVIDKGVAPSDIALYRMAELRYLGQDETILVRGSSGVVDREWVADLAHRFTDEYQLRRGGTIPGVAVELVAFRVRAEGRRHSWSKPSEHVRTGAGCASRHVRPVYFPDRGGFVDCQVVRRHDVLDDWVVSGPAIIEEPESTTVVGPDATASVSDGQLVLAIG